MWGGGNWVSLRLRNGSPAESHLMKTAVDSDVVANIKLSLIVTTYDLARMSDITELLMSVSSQKILNLEMIFVVEGSRSLAEKIEQLGGRIQRFPVRVILRTDSIGISASRNLGIEAAEGEIIAFVDDDVILPPYWSGKLQEIFASSVIGAVTGPAFPIWKDKEASWLPPAFHWLVSCTTWFRAAERCETRNVWGMNMAFSRQIFEAGLRFPVNIGGIRGKRLHGEEAVLCFAIRKRLQKKIIFEPKLFVYHKVYPFRKSPRFMMKSAYYMGSSRRLQKQLYGSYSAIGLEFDLGADMVNQGLLWPISEIATHPRLALRKILMTLIILLSASVGYLAYNAKSTTVIPPSKTRK